MMLHMNKQHVVGVEFHRDPEGHDAYVLVDRHAEAVGYVRSRPYDSVNVAINEMFSQADAYTIDEVRGALQVIINLEESSS